MVEWIGNCVVLGMNGNTGARRWLYNRSSAITHYCWSWHYFSPWGVLLSLPRRIFPHEHRHLGTCVHPNSRAASTSLSEAVCIFGPAHQRSCYNHAIIPYFAWANSPFSPLHQGLPSTALYTIWPLETLYSIQPFRSLWCSFLNVTARAASWLPCYMFIINFSREDYSQYYYQMHFLSIESALVPKDTCDLFSP